MAPPTRFVGSRKEKKPDLSTLPSRVVVGEQTNSDVTSLPSRAVPYTESNPDLAFVPRYVMGSSVAGQQTAPPPAANLGLVPLAPKHVLQRPSVLPAPLLPLAAGPRVLSSRKKRNTRMAIYVDISGQIHARGSRSLRSCENIESFLEILCTKCEISEASIASVTVRFPCLEGEP